MGTILIALSLRAGAADFSASWSGSSGDWSDGTLWSTAPAFPNDGSGATYDAAVSSGTVMLDRDITIERLSLTGGEVYGDFRLTLNKGLTWSGGNLNAGGNINLAAGSTSTLSGPSPLTIGRPTLLNSGTITQTADVTVLSGDVAFISNLAGGTWNLLQHKVTAVPNQSVVHFENSGTLVALDAEVDGYFGNSGTVTVQSNIGTTISTAGPVYHGLFASAGGFHPGTFNLIAPAALILASKNANKTVFQSGCTITGDGTVVLNGETQVTGNTTIDANVEVYSGLQVYSPAVLTLNGTFQTHQGGLGLFGGTVTNPNNPLIIRNNQLFGYGTVNGDVIGQSTDVEASGSAPLIINGDLTLELAPSQDTSKIVFDLFGSQLGNSFLSVGKGINLNYAQLSLATTSDFRSQIGNGAYTLADAAQGFTGAFVNGWNGQLVSGGGNTWFRINYGPNSPYAPNELVLSNQTTSLINNGTFDDLNGDHTVAQWSSNGNVRIANEGFTSLPNCVALSYGANSEGDRIYQFFNTTVGQVYALDFDAAIYGVPDANALLLIQVDVYDNTNLLLDDRQAPPVANSYVGTDVVFHHYHYTFTAKSTTSTVQFSNVGLGNGSADEVIDNVIIASPLPSPTPTTLPLVNGDFELGPTESFGSVTGWTVSGNGRLKATAEGATNGTHSAAFNAVGDSQGNVLSQRFFTTPGGVYFLDFDAGVFGQPSGGPLQLRAQVIGSSARLDQTVTPPDAFTFDPNQVAFGQYHYQFMADSTVTTIQFSDIGAGSAAADMELDAVSIAPRVTSSISVISPPSPPAGGTFQISGLYLPGATVRILQSFDLIHFDPATTTPCDSGGAYSTNVNTPAGHTAVFFKVVSP